MFKLPPLADVNIRNEVIGGFTTFLTMSYIIVVNPGILATPGTGMSFSGVLAATVLVSSFMTIAMGLFAGLPFALAPGMGLNAFFTFTIILGQQVPWPVALGMVFWSGLVFLVISLTPLRERILMAVPKNLQIAASVGIGLFLTFIGLKNSGLIVADPVTFVKFGGLGFESCLAVLGLFIIAFFVARKSSLAYLLGMAVVTVLALVLGKVSMPSEVFAQPELAAVMFKVDIMGALKLSFLPIIISLFFTDLFDSLSTFMGVSEATGLVDTKGKPLNIRPDIRELQRLYNGVLTRHRI